MDCKDRFKKIERMLDNEHRENNNIRAELKAHKAQLDILSGAKWTEQPTPDPIEVGDTVRILDDKDFADRLKPTIGAEVEVINVIGGDLRIKMPSGVPQVIRKDQVALVRKDPNDPKSWKAGDWVECVDICAGNGPKIGEKYQIKSISPPNSLVLFCKQPHIYVGTKDDGYQQDRFKLCSPPSKWDKATHVKYIRTLNNRAKPRRIESQDAENVYYKGHNPPKLWSWDRKSSLTPLREVRTPGRKKGEFVPCAKEQATHVSPGTMCLSEHGLDLTDIRNIFTRPIEADEPDTVTYVECK